MTFAQSRASLHEASGNLQKPLLWKFVGGFKL